MANNLHSAHPTLVGNKMKLLQNITLALLVSLSAQAVEVGDKAEAFTLEYLKESSSFDSKSLGNGVYLLNIWAQWCKGCKEEMPLFNEVAKKYADKGFKIIAVNIDTKQKKAKKFVKKLESKLGETSSIIFLYDKKKELAKAYDAKVIPISLLIKDQKIQHIYLGSCKQSSELTVEIDRLLK